MRSRGYLGEGVCHGCMPSPSSLVTTGGASIKILFLDIETSPNTAHVWGLFKQNVSINQLMESSYVMCWAAKWAGSETIEFDSVYQSTPRNMVKRIHALLEEADMVVHYHGTAFDIPTLNKEFLLHRLAPPSPSKEVDLLKVVRKKFRFPSNKLDYVAQRLKIGKKYEHQGHALWVGCMANDPACWVTMEEYNRYDVVLLEKLYYILLPWMQTHLNFSTFLGASVCPTCGSARYQRRGYTHTQVGTYARYQCNKCKGWFKSPTPLPKGKYERFVIY